MLAAAGGACSLGLDPSKIPGADAGADVTVMDAGIDAPNPVQCKMDPDCKSANACLSGKCINNQCTYTECAAQACNAAVCDPVAHTCSAPAAYGFHAGTFHVAQGNIGCGGSAPRCFAAVFPFVFVGTVNGVVAFSVANPTSTSPSPIPVAGLPFFPTFIVASGPTVYFIGTVVGVGPTYDVPIASLSVPTDPTVTEMEATTVFNSLPYPQIDGVFPDAANGIYLLRADATKSYPATRISAPLTDLATLSFAPAPGVATGASIVAASGSRLVTYRQDNANPWDTHFSLETMAATPSAQNAGEQSMLTTVGTQTAQPSWIAQGPDGGILWVTDAVSVPDGGSSPTYVGARLSWILDDQGGTTFNATTHVDVGVYSTTATNNLAGPIAWVDSNTAISISAVPTNLNQSLVQVASRNGPPTVEMNKSFQLAWQPNQLAVTASNGFGYVLTPDPTNGANVHVFDTGCNN